MSTHDEHKHHDLRRKIHEVITEADTPAGRWFDIILFLFILASVAIVMLETMDSLAKYTSLFIALEWIFTIFFTIEYGLRLYSTYKPMKYATSFFGVIDLLAIIPTYLGLLFGGYKSLMVIRALRLLRIFRILKLAKFTRQGKLILSSLRHSFPKIFVFLLFVVVVVMIFGAIMYLIEGGNNDGFDSIPRSVYWAIVTLTTVGYGDITPSTPLGQFIAACVMLLGYAVIAVPTGIISSEIVRSNQLTEPEALESTNTQICQFCSKAGHADDAEYCKHCGESLTA